MFKAIKEFFLGKPAETAQPDAAPYKVETPVAPAPVVEAKVEAKPAKAPKAKKPAAPKAKAPAKAKAEKPAKKAPAKKPAKKAQ